METQLIPVLVIMLAFMAAVLLYAVKATIMVNRHSIVIRDISYPLVIDNYAIKSIKLVENLPVITNFVGGYKLLHRIKGICNVVSPKPDTKRFSDVSMIVENKKSNCFIEIETTFGFVYINKRNEEQTKKLYDEMMETIHFVNESELEMPDKIGKPRSLFTVIVFMLFTFGGGLLFAELLINKI